MPYSPRSLSSAPRPVKPGRRGAFLIVVSVLFIIFGVSMAITPEDDLVVSLSYAFPTYLTQGSLSFWGGSFIAVGLVIISSSTRPLGKDSWGFSVAAGCALMWATFGAFSSLFFGAPRGWVMFLMWSAVSGSIVIVSGMRGVHDE